MTKFALRFSIRKEVGVHEVVDDGLIGRFDFFELDAHADAAIAPGDTPFGVDVALGSGHPETHADLEAAVERARRADGDAAAAQVERQGRRNRVAEPILDRNAEAKEIQRGDRDTLMPTVANSGRRHRFGMALDAL